VGTGGLPAIRAIAAPASASAKSSGEQVGPSSAHLRVTTKRSAAALSAR
jgi:hypothetical protein